jgi:hypothetical protein
VKNWVVKQMKAKEIRDLTTSEIEEQIKRNASRATSSFTPAISNKILPGFATAIQPSTAPLPARIAMTRFMKRGGKVWIKIFPHTPYTQKPLEVRMGC